MSECIRKQRQDRKQGSAINPKVHPPDIHFFYLDPISQSFLQLPEQHHQLGPSVQTHVGNILHLKHNRWGGMSPQLGVLLRRQNEGRVQASLSLSTLNGLGVSSLLSSVKEGIRHIKGQTSTWLCNSFTLPGSVAPRAEHLPT